ncbi:GTP pyrophosphokinase [gamma proteobacterium HdN1]|nr:GTP pyrophosphokinase [gamma proteobacterium HdN1]
MVKVREDRPRLANGQVDLQAWVGRLRNSVEINDEEGLIALCQLASSLEEKAATSSEYAWAAGASSFLTGLEMAEILADLHLDTDSLKAAVIYRAVREGQITLESVRKTAGPGIAKLIEGVLRMAAISVATNPEKKVVLGQSSDQLDNLRKMLIAMIDDVRVALIKLAERTCAIRAVKDAPDAKRQRVAREVFDIYAPLAHRLGIGHIKWELEDLAFRYLQPDAYMRIAKLLDEKRIDRQEYIRRVVASLRDALAEIGIEAEVKGRAKHIYSIWRKMKRKSIDFYQVYDVRAVRVLVPEIRDCYAALGIAHNLWQHIPREFDDYIATPKENGYRSLHTAVLGPEGKVLEVQIRTFSMHEEAELGVCAHWRYKEGNNQSDQSYESKIAWLRQVLEWQEELGDAGISSVLAQFSQDMVEERIYVFTPEGHVVDLAHGATPVDFAYHIHTEVGHGCRGARVNGRIVPLTYILKTGEQVEILRGPTSGPSRDWLNPSLGFVHTPRARAKILHWFKLQDRDQNILDGKAILEREFHRLDIRKVEWAQIAPALNLRTVEDVYAAVGAGDVRVAQVLNAIQDTLGEPEQEALLPLDVRRPRVNQKASPLAIDGIDNLLTHIAGCCKPVPGDSVVGYISLGRGITVHAQGCQELGRLAEQHPERLIDVVWSESQDQVYPVEIVILCNDRQGLLRDVTSVLANAHVNVTGVNTHSERHTNTATIQVTLEVGGLARLGDVLTHIQQIPSVIEVKRLHSVRPDPIAR